MKLRELIAKTSPITLGLVLVHLLLLGGRLASARPTRPRRLPGAERPIVAKDDHALRDLQMLTPERGLAVVHGLTSGGWLLDWTHSARLDETADLTALQLFGDPTVRRADQSLVLDDRLVTVTGTRGYAWRYTWDEARQQVVRQRLPAGFLWLDPTGEAVTETTVQLPSGWPAIYPPSVMTSEHLVVARPMVERETPKRAHGKDTIVRTRAGDRGLMLFDKRDGHPIAMLETEGIREMFRVPGWPGFAWTDDSSCWLDYVHCDEAGSCRQGTSKLRATEPVLAASFRPDLKRLAVCSTYHVLFYEGEVDGDVRYLGRTPISKPCRGLVLTSPNGAAVMLENRKWVMVTTESRP